MAISEAFTGSESVTATEWSLTTDTAGPDTETSDGVFQVFLDVNAIAAADLFRFRIYEKAASGDTQRIAYEAFLGGPQAAPVWVSPALILINGWDMTLFKVSGTDRTITWSIRKVA